MARSSKDIFEKFGIFTTPTISPRYALAAEVVDAVKNFYCSDDVSRLMPGRKDFVSVKYENGRIHQQKRLILNNLNEVYNNFKSENPNMKIGFSRFASLRPENCVLAGASGTHSVCICTHHQNPKLMLEACKAYINKSDPLYNMLDYKTLHQQMICKTPTKNCYFSQCDNCPGTNVIRQELENTFKRNNIDNITFNQWVSTDRTTLETITRTANDFIDFLMDMLQKLLRHSFIAKQQGEFLKKLKENVPIGHFIVLGDFSENYSFVLQDEAQGFHWNNDQATIHPFGFYYKNDEGDLLSGNFVPISDCRKHDTILIHLFQTYFLNYLKENFKPKKIIYFSDGCGGQYKNRKNFLNLTLHESDFGIPAEWNFFATSHGKTISDGLGGTIKRLAARASLQRPYSDQIMTAKQLFEWASTNIPGIKCAYVSNSEYIEIEDKMNERYNTCKTVAGTLKLHQVVPVSVGVVKTKLYSCDNKYRIQKLLKRNTQIELL